MTDERKRTVGGLPIRTLFWSAFWSTILIFAALYVYANLKLARLSEDHQGRVLVSERFYEEWRQVLPEVFVDMGEALDTAGAKTEQIVARQINTAFAPVYQRIPVFLDFHYSVIGEYTELSAAVAGGAGVELKRILFDEVDFDQRLNDAIASIQSESDTVLSTALTKINEGVREKLDLAPSELALLGKVVTLSMEDAGQRFTGSELMLKSAGAMVGAGAAAALMTKTIGKKIASKLATKAAAKTAAKAASGVGGGAASGAAAGMLCGPLAWLCAPVGGVAGAVTFWLVTDKVIIEVDEYFNKETFEAELRAILDEEKARLSAEIGGLYQARIHEILTDNENRLREITTRQLIDQGG